MVGGSERDRLQFQTAGEGATPVATVTFVPASVVAPASAPAAAPVAAPTAPAVAEASPGLTYAVFGVASNDVLNVRAKPDVANKKVYSYAPVVFPATTPAKSAMIGSRGWVASSTSTESRTFQR